MNESPIFWFNRHLHWLIQDVLNWH